MMRVRSVACCGGRSGVERSAGLNAQDAFQVLRHVSQGVVGDVVVVVSVGKAHWGEREVEGREDRRRYRRAGRNERKRLSGQAR